MALGLKPTPIPPVIAPVFNGDGSHITAEPRPEWVPAPFQEKQLQRLVKELQERPKGSGANFSDMGCYKTSTALWLAQRLGCKHVLIITTKTGKIPYMQAAPKAVPEYDTINLNTNDPVHKPEAHEKIIFFAHYEVFSKRLPRNAPAWQKKLTPKKKRPYQRLNSTAKELNKIKWDMVIVSEAHRLTRSATWTNTIVGLKSQYRHEETGTLYINRPDEAQSPLRFMDKERYGSYWDFRRKFCEEKEWPPLSGFYHISGIKDEKAFKAELLQWGPRAMFTEVFDAAELMPPHRVSVNLNPTQRRMYRELEKSKETLDLRGQPLFSPNVISVLMRLRQLCVATPFVVANTWNEKTEKMQQEIDLQEPSPKLEALMDLLQDTDTPSVVFSNFKTPLELAARRLVAAGISHTVLRQKDSDEVRFNKVNEFQEGKTRVFLSTISLGSESITLTAADKVIFLDRSWSPQKMSQAVSRVHRPGQKRPVLPIYIEALNTVDQVVEATLIKKQDWFDAVFG